MGYGPTGPDRMGQNWDQQWFMDYVGHGILEFTTVE